MTKSSGLESRNETPITKMGNVLLRLSLKYMPDASIFAVALTFIAFCLGIALTDQGPMQMVQNWYKGFWELLGFSMQMALIVITGSCVANAPLVKGWINRIASIPKSAKSAVFTVTLVSVLVSFVHWGLSLIVGAILAKELAKNLRDKKIPFEYGLMAAGAYVGQMTWQGVLSSSVGLFIATPGHIMEDLIGVVPMTDYMLNPTNICVTIALAIGPAFFATLLLPKNPSDYQPLDEDAIKAIEKEDLKLQKRPSKATVGDILNYSPILAWALGLLGFIYIFYAFYTKGFNALDFNLLNAIFLFGGILLYGNIANYVMAVKDAVGGTAGIIFSVSSVCRCPWHCEILRSGHGFSQWDRGSQHRKYFLSVDFLIRSDRKYVCSFRWWAVGCTGAGGSGIGQNDGSRFGKDRADGGIWELLDQYGTAILGDCSSGNHGS